NAIVYSLHSTGFINIQNNTFSGIHQGGVTITPDGGNTVAIAGKGAVISYNDFIMDAHWTNSYALGLGGGFFAYEVAYNVAKQKNGSGMQHDPGGGRMVLGKIHDNYLTAYEPCTIEYAANMNATALRTRDFYDNCFRDILWYNN